MIRHAFVTALLDDSSFPGAVATVNSILHFHPRSDVVVVVDSANPLSAPQVQCFRASERVRIVESRELQRAGRRIGPGELKAYAACDLLRGCDVLVGIDPDSIVCSAVDDVVAACHESKGFWGPSHDPPCIRTSLYFVANTPENQSVLERWVEACTAAPFEGAGELAGDGDQVLDAVLHAAGAAKRIHRLDDALWSQHGGSWSSAIELRGGVLVNRSLGVRQRAFQVGGPEKFWTLAHRERLLGGHALQTHPYVWFLTMLWFGRCRSWAADPYDYLPPDSRHLFDDLIDFLPQIFQVSSPARHQWRSVSDAMLDRALGGIPRACALGGGNMSDVIALVDAHPHLRRYVEVGSYEGGSIFTLALRFANRDIDFYAVDSFQGNGDGTMDGRPLPSRKRFYAHRARFPTLRVSLVPGDSAHASALFDDASVDCVFIDACHETPAVLRDIDAWLPKIARGGIVAGDDYDWSTVRRAVDDRFPEAHVTASGQVWWTRV